VGAADGAATVCLRANIGFSELAKGKKTYSRWSPSLPDQLPGIELDRTMEGGKIARLG
jgi:hypothetical protein